MKTNDGSPFPTRLKQARTRLGLSQKQLGIMAGMDKFVASARMNQYERGVHTPDFKTVVALSGVLKVPTAFLYCIEDELAEKILDWSVSG
ncbi:helix-turn-helix transcriptional regulator [Pseudoalteromonas piscicida]|uniref:XRE family transcriptional regulator n=3 Tax=Alteromonas australica TaxID=589873 RepID=A0A358DVH5_9ALTE|nr:MULTISPECIES: helix-turn-helix transcriptional regulator [Alteromonadales]MBU34243.1 transcriptional regulator [Alteromonas sp.]AUI84397.1 transcriptional regulator [Alteromonas macleodii]RZG04029.1 XRE family transcriptional regulator [Pseudoalteromonas sp. CO348]UDM62724.1 helix-turn-helix transcriptional regulator [Pseudoalteromonas piscicida]WJG09394.1 helix-turn-helix transcriptional regulator [Aliiglaciecola sp. LCG003]